MLSCSCKAAPHRHRFHRAYNSLQANFTWLRSPDREYVAEVVVDSGTVEILDLYKMAGTSYNVFPSHQVFPGVNDLNGILWLPRHRHTLVIATLTDGSSWDNAVLEIFDGATLKPLVRAAGASSDAFQLYGASDDGRMIVYGYCRNYVPEWSIRQAMANDRRLDRRRYLRIRL